MGFVDPELGQQGDRDPPEADDVLADLPADVDHWIGDQLPGRVQGHLPAARGLGTEVEILTKRQPPNR